VPAQIALGILLLLTLESAGMVSAADDVARRTFRTSDGVVLSFLESGRIHAASSHAAVAMIPGWCMPAHLWRGQLEHLGRRYHVLALDPRGQGDSQVPKSGYTAERRARDIHEFIESLGQVLLVGWSLGAIESLQYVHMYGAQRLAGLVLVDSSVGEDPAPAPGAAFARRLRSERDTMLREFVSAIFVKPRPNDEIEALVRGAKRISLDDSLALLSYPFERTHWKGIVHGFKKPLLYAVTPQFAAQAENLKKHRPATRIEIFPDAGHALFVDQPERFNALIEEFAGTLSRREL
jgi:microsomal epoxide hydrolase